MDVNAILKQRQSGWGDWAEADDEDDGIFPRLIWQVYTEA